MSGLKRLILWKLSLVYRLFLFLWDWYWRWAKKVKLPGKVISIGNITAGGTGKTPLAIYMGNMSVKTGLRTAVVAKGYKRPVKGLVEVKDNSTWLEVGDEPLEIFKRTENVRVYVDQSKTVAARKAADDGAEIIIIDDGFQHRRLQRDINIVCLDWSEPFGPGGLLPLGLLREPIKALSRADVIVYTNYNEDIPPNRKLPEFADGIKHYYSSSTITRLKDIKTDAFKDIAESHNKTMIAFCGLGNPEKFRQSLYHANILPERFIAFRDHFRYAQKDIDIIIEQAAITKVDCLITTFKDAVKIRGLDFKGFDVYLAEIEINLTDEHGDDRREDLERYLGL